MIKVLIADDHDILREGVKQILADCGDITVAAEARDGVQTLARLREQEFDLVLLDMAMPGGNGIELIKEIQAADPRARILVLSMYKEEQYAARALKAGASGYLCKDNAATQLVEAIRTVARGGVFLGPAAIEKLAVAARGGGDEPELNLLSDREFQIFRLLAAGTSVTRIAQSLALSVKTVSTYKTRIMEKMQFANMSELIRYAAQHNLINDGRGGRS